MFRQQWGYVANGISIRHTERRDISDIVSLVTREFAFDAEEVERRVREQVSERPGQLRRDRRPNLVLEIDGAFAGYVSVKVFEVDDTQIRISRERGSTAVLAQIAVEPKFRERGGGTALLQAAIDGTRDAAYSQLLAHIVPDDAPFYKNLGFQVPPAGAGWTWIEERTVDDLNLARMVNADDPNGNWVPVLVEVPTVAGYPILARLVFKDMPAAVAFEPRPGEHPGLSGNRALAERVRSIDGWDRVPGAATELKRYLR
jgi:predicted N-acetyltransferase YhbS